MDGEDKMEMYLHSCRICLGKHAIKDILSTKRAYNINDVSCREMILSLFSIEVRAEDGLPNKLCLKCYSTICSAYNLKTVAISSQARLLRLKEEVKDECVAEEEGEVLPLEWVEEWSPARESAAPLHRKPSLETALFEEVNKENKEVAEPKKKRGRPPKKLAEDGQGEMKTVRKRGSKGEVCEQCGKVVMSLTTHLRSHSGTQPFPCSLCQRVFKNLSSRKRHHATHHLGQLYYCQICKKHFKNGPNHNLFMHSERTREHACVMCDKRFHTRARLQKHVSVHTKERPFPCTVCGKFFRTRMDSVYHRRSVHEKERSYVCQFCPRAFFSSTKLKEHLRMHTKEFAYFCKECGKGFSSSSGLRSHERHHSGRKDVPCILCGRAFASKG